MKLRTVRRVVLVAFLTCLCSPASAAAQEPAPAGESSREPRVFRGNRIVFGAEDVVIPADTVQRGDIVSIFGAVRVEGRVMGSVTVVGGGLQVSGSVDKDVIAVLSGVELESSSRIDGELINIGGTLEDGGASIGRGFTNFPLGLTLGNATEPLGALISLLYWGRALSLVMFFVVILLVASLVPDRVRVISDETPRRYFAALIVGLLGYVLFFFVWIFSAITVIGLVVVPLIFLLLKWMAMAGLLHALGTRLGAGPGRPMSLLGAIFLGFLPYAAIVILPMFIGPLGLLLGLASKALLWLLVELPAVGMLLLTRAGSRGGAMPEPETGPVDPPVD